MEKALTREIYKGHGNKKSILKISVSSRNIIPCILKISGKLQSILTYEGHFFNAFQGLFQAESGGQL